MGGRRDLKKVPYHLRDTDPDLYNFLLDIQNSESDGVPGGAGTSAPSTIQAGDTGDAGTESLGWAPIDHEHAVETGTAVGLANSNGGGTGTALARASHTHKRDVRVAKAGSDVGTRNRLNFADTASVTWTITDDAGNDEIDISAAATGSDTWREVAAFRYDAADSDDDEFRDGSFSGFTTMDDASDTPVWTEKGDVLSAAVAGTVTASGWAVAAKTVAGLGTGDYVETAVRLLTEPTSQIFRIGVCFTNNDLTGGSGSLAVVGFIEIDNSLPDRISFNLGRLKQTSEDGSFPIRTPTQFWAWVAPWIHLRLVYVAANTFRLLGSPDGVSWITMTPDESITLTPAGIGVAFGGHIAAPAIATFEYLRVTQ